MTFGQGTVGISPKQSAGGGGSVSGANNGLDLDGSNAVLGQDVSEAGNPAILLSDREIPTDGNKVSFNAGTSANTAIEVTGNNNNVFPGIEIINTNTGAAAKSAIQITGDGATDINLKVGIDSSGATIPNRRFINSRNGILHIGDTENAGNGSKIIITDTGNILEAQRAAGTTLFRITSAGRVGATDFYDIIGTDIAQGNILGDGYNTLGAGQGNGIKFRDNAGQVPFTFAFGSGTPVATINAAVVINENGADKDVRIEGDTDANLFFTDASTDRVGIGTSTPDQKLHVNGAIKTAVVNGSAGAVKLGIIRTGTVSFDTTQYWEVDVDGITYAIALGTPV